MTAPTGQPQPPILLSNHKHIPIQLLYHNLFRFLRPCRDKYNLTVNELLVLNGIYLYTLIRKNEFTINAIYSWVMYYNKPRMKYYFDRLIKAEIMLYHTTIGNHVYYRLTPKGYNIVGEMFDRLEVIQQKFLQKWNVSI